MFKLTGFGDEISSDLTTQLEVMESLGIKHLELRGIKGKNVLELSDEEIEEARQILKEKDFKISAIASPIGKIKISDDFSLDLERLKKAISLAHSFETKYIRIFSYYLPKENHLSYGQEVVRRIRKMTEISEKEKFILLLENEDDIYGNTPERCLEILESINSPYLRSTFDPANFIIAEVKPYKEAFPKMIKYIEYLHIKDARFSDKVIVPAGEGEGEIKEILKELKEINFDGFLSLEPHLAISGKMNGFSGAKLFEKAARALKKILEEI